MRDKIISSIRYLFRLFMVSLLVSGCTFIPALEIKEFPAPPRFPDGEGYDSALMNKSTTSVLSAIAWRNFFQDEALQNLIAIGLKNNRDLRTAALNIAEARALYGVERSDLTPDLNVEGSYTREDIGAATTEFYTANLGVTAYEIDLFGRIRSLNEAALNEYLATEAAHQSVRITLIADIATNYVDLRANRALLKLAEETVRVQSAAFDLIRLRAEEGVASDLELRQSEILLHQARVDRHQYLDAINRDLNVLRLLLGKMEKIPVLKEAAFENLFDDFVADVPAGLPSTLLTSRPDIMRAEYQLRAANANIGAAQAAFFPTLSLTAAGGYMAGEFSELFEDGSRLWRFAPQLSLPIFTGGRLKNSLDLAQIRTDIAVLNYERTIETAFREVADALSEVSSYDDRVRAQTDLVTATEEATRISQLRYDTGVENYLTVLDARRELYAARQGAISLKDAQIKAKIALYRAVGGGR